MKAAVVIGLAMVVGALGYYLVSRENESHTSAETYRPHQPDPPTTTNTDADEVFKQAFWKRPTADDHILHAERREWEDADGVDRWQWFIAVDPSKDLAHYLHEQNPFSMGTPKGEATMPLEPRPGWFPKSAAGFTARQTRDGRMLFLSDPVTGRLFASSEGRGFAKPVEVTPAPARLGRESEPSRIPTTPPPSSPEP